METMVNTQFAGSKTVHGATLLHLQEAWKTARPEMGSVAVFMLAYRHIRALATRVCARGPSVVYSINREGYLDLNKEREKTPLQTPHRISSTLFPNTHFFFGGCFPPFFRDTLLLFVLFSFFFSPTTLAVFSPCFVLTAGREIYFAGTTKASRC